MPSIALFLCLIFIGWLLVRDVRRRKAVSAAVWIPVLLLLILGSRSVTQWLDIRNGITWGSQNDSGGSLPDQAFYILVQVAAWFIAFRRGFRWKRFFSANNALMLLYVFFLASLIWSDYPLSSAKRLLKDFGMFAVVGLILSEKDPAEAMRAIYSRTAAFLLPLSILLIRYFPSYARNYDEGGELTYTGITTQKNSLGEIVLIFSLFMMWDWLESRSTPAKYRSKTLPWDIGILLLMGGYLLYISHSQTAFVCLLIGAFLIFSKGWLSSRAVCRVVLYGALTTPFLLFFSQQATSFIQPIVAALGRDMTFTGRTNIWSHISFTTVNPLIGAGYYNFWGGRHGVEVSIAAQQTIPTAHCGYLDIYLDGGICGLLFLLWLLISSGKRIVSKVNVDRYQRVRFAFLIVLIIYNLTESVFARAGPLWFTSQLMLIGIPVLRGSLKRIRQHSPAPRDPDFAGILINQPLAVD